MDLITFRHLICIVSPNKHFRKFWTPRFLGNFQCNFICESLQNYVIVEESFNW